MLMEGPAEQRAKGCRGTCLSSVKENETVSMQAELRMGSPIKIQCASLAKGDWSVI